MKGVCVGEMVHAFLDASSRRHKTAHVCVCDRVRVQEVGVLVCVCVVCVHGVGARPHATIHNNSAGNKS